MAEAARVYAEALFEAGKDKGKPDSLHEQLAQFTDAVPWPDYLGLDAIATAPPGGIAA